MDTPVYHVVLEGRRIGPYDRRTIVGMRIKNTLTSEHVVITTDGVELRVSDLLKNRDNNFQPNRSGSYSLVQATFPASLVDVHGEGPQVPAFKGEIEARVQKDVLRVAGRYRQGLGWKEDRIKIPLDTIVHARVRNTLVDLGLRRAGSARLQRITLELFTAETAGELVDWLPSAQPWPAGDPPPQPAAAPASHAFTWAALAGTLVAVGGVTFWLLLRR